MDDVAVQTIDEVAPDRLWFNWAGTRAHILTLARMKQDVLCGLQGVGASRSRHGHHEGARPKPTTPVCKRCARIYATEDENTREALIAEACEVMASASDHGEWKTTRTANGFPKQAAALLDAGWRPRRLP